MDTSQDFAMFKQIHQTLVPASIWIVAKQRPNCLKLMRFMAKLCCKIYEHKHFECLNCDTYTTREFDHRVVTCSSNDSINTRELYFSHVRLTFGVSFCDRLLNSNSKQFIRYIFGYKDDLIESELDSDSYTACQEVLTV